MQIDLNNCDEELKELFEIFKAFIMQKKLYTGEYKPKKYEPIWKR